MNRLMLVLGLALLFCSICIFIIYFQIVSLPKLSSHLVPLSQPIICFICGAGPNPLTISDGSPGNLIVQGELPKQMNNQTSDTISLLLTIPRDGIQGFDNNNIFTPTPTPLNRIMLTPTVDQSLNLDLYQHCLDQNPASNNQQLMDCKNSTSISTLFGPGYEVSASAYLIATSFDVQQLGPTDQSTDQAQIEWNWNIFPKSDGSQIINIGIDLYWKPTSNNGSAIIVRQLWQTFTIITVNPPSFFELGQITFAGLLTALLTSIVGSSILTSVFNQRKARKKNGEQGK